MLEQWLAKEGEFYSNNDNGRSAPSDRVLFDSPRSAAMLAETQGLLTSGGGIYVGENPGGQDALLKMADGSAPASMAIASSAALGPVLQAVTNGLIPGVGADDLGIGPMPSPNGAQGALIGGASLWLTAGRGGAKVAAAWNFITYLVSPEVQSRWAAATGYVPVNSAAAEMEPLRSLYTSDARFRVAFDQVVQAPDTASFTSPALGPLREVRSIAAQAVGRALAGADPATALEEAAILANEVIQNYNA